MRLIELIRIAINTLFAMSIRRISYFQALTSCRWDIRRKNSIAASCEHQDRANVEEFPMVLLRCCESRFHDLNSILDIRADWCNFLLLFFFFLCLTRLEYLEAYSFFSSLIRYITFIFPACHRRNIRVLNRLVNIISIAIYYCNTFDSKENSCRGGERYVGRDTRVYVS